MGRFWKEAAAFLVQPVRGFNRLVSGHASRQEANPEDPMDWRPPGGGTFLALGARTIGRGESISENTRTTGYFEFGGQSFGPSLLSRFDLGGTWGLRTRLDGNLMLLGAINSEYAKIADVADRERLREYDYGPGLGGEFLATLTRNGRGLLAAGYRFQWINVSNGSVYNNDQLGISTSAEHYIQIAVVRLVLPIKGNLGIGGDAAMFFRKSRYEIEAFHDIDQRNPQARVYLTVNGFR